MSFWRGLLFTGWIVWGASCSCAGDSPGECLQTYYDACYRDFKTSAVVWIVPEFYRGDSTETSKTNLLLPSPNDIETEFDLLEIGLAFDGGIGPVDPIYVTEVAKTEIWRNPKIWDNGPLDPGLTCQLAQEEVEALGRSGQQGGLWSIETDSGKKIGFCEQSLDLNRRICMRLKARYPGLRNVYLWAVKRFTCYHFM